MSNGEKVEIVFSDENKVYEINYKGLEHIETQYIVATDMLHAMNEFELNNVNFGTEDILRIEQTEMFFAQLMPMNT